MKLRKLKKKKTLRAEEPSKTRLQNKENEPLVKRKTHRNSKREREEKTYKRKKMKR